MADGRPFNAAAVKWNFDRVVDPNFKAGGALAQLTGYQGSDIVDDCTVRVRFEGATRAATAESGETQMATVFTPPGPPAPPGSRTADG